MGLEALDQRSKMIIFESHLTTFEMSWGSGENLLEPKTKPK